MLSIPTGFSFRSASSPLSRSFALPLRSVSSVPRVGSGLVLGIMLLGACNAPPGVNPWVDDSIPCTVWTTPSQDRILASQHQPVVRQRSNPQTVGPYVSQDVPHYPLWWEDPFEDKGDLNREFAWTWQDYFAMPYSYGRFIVNTVGFPVSAVCTPPCTPMVSDGCVPADAQHDARRGVSNDPDAGPRDFGFDREETAVASAPAA